MLDLMLKSMIECTLISNILDRICEMTKKCWNIQEMILYKTPSNICFKLEHVE
jgi:hypothetical protein